MSRAQPPVDDYENPATATGSLAYPLPSAPPLSNPLGFAPQTYPPIPGSPPTPASPPLLPTAANGYVAVPTEPAVLPPKYVEQTGAPPTGGRKRNRRAILMVTGAIIVIVIAAVVAFVVVRNNNNSNSSSSGSNGASNSTTSPGGGVVVVNVQTHNTKLDWMNAMAATFNSQQKTVAGSTKTIQINITVSSNLTDAWQPIAWSPANYLWVDQEYSRRSALRGAPFKTADIYTACQSTTTTPLGILMWRTFAQALGWPDSPIGFRDILALATAPDGWSIRGQPQYGAFKFGHGHPEYSNSGRLSILAALSSFSNLTQGAQLTTSLVTSNATFTNLKTFASSVYHMGTNDQALLSLMLSKGVNYLHGMTTYESVVINTNVNNASNIAEPVEFIYLSDGTFWQEHPYCVLDNVAWATADKIDGANQFLTFLRSSAAQNRLPEFGLRPLASLIANGSAGVTAMLCNGTNTKFTRANGVDCTKNEENIHLLQYPNVTVMSTVVQTWYAAKKPVTVAVVIDTSGSMQFDGKLIAAKAAAQLFINQLRDNDILFNLVAGLFPEEETLLRDSVVMSSQLVSAARTNDRSMGLHIFSIGVGGDADLATLSTISKRTNAYSYQASTADIASIYFAISLEF
ncbi:hypothetical protein HDU93_001352 [Gonapodya sp. JEL0774]|nr:hypothetical protein HDU93_001352 [Gonapodya sp. JEL0774]